jgi:hypothetical protein
LSHLTIDLKVDRGGAAPVIAGVVATQLREIARRVEAAAGPIEIKSDEQDIEGWAKHDRL